MVSSNHKMVLANGTFQGTTRQELTAAFDAYLATGATQPITMHFHGGLVSQSDAEQMADRLFPIYQGGPGYPFFVIWQAGLGEQLRNNWQELIKLDEFSRLVDRVLQFVIGKLDQSPGARGDQLDLPPRTEIQAEIKQKEAVGAVPFADRDADAEKIDPNMTPAEEEQLRALVEADPVLANAGAKLITTPNPAVGEEIKNDVDRVRAEVDPQARGLISTSVLAWAAVRIGWQSIKRLAGGRGHGIYTTVVEEVARELKGGLLGGLVWEQMKKDTADSFGDPGDTHGGTALLEEIARVYAAGHTPRIVLIGHSTGAVYICYLLRKAKAMLPPTIKFDVVFLAPACTFDLLDEALLAAGDRVSWFRSFGMQDDLEQKDAIFPPIYGQSLLYLVSGLLETEVDAPLVGMQRYHAGAKPFDADAYPGIKRVIDQFSGGSSPWLWSECNGGAGLGSKSAHHGDFDNDEETLKSVVHLIANGVI